VVKRRKIREIIRSNNIDFLAIQETKRRCWSPCAIVYGAPSIVIGCFFLRRGGVVVFSLCGVRLIIPLSSHLWEKGL
jgi:hypothetical protein